MATLASIRNQLLDELARTGQLTSQAHTYINQAIKHYKKKNFYFNEKRTTLTSSAGAEYYDLTADFAILHSLTIRINTNDYPLRQRTFSQIDDMYSNQYSLSASGTATVSSLTGYPQDFAIYNYKIRLHPIPAGAYQMKMAYRREAEQLSSTASTNVLIENADDLIIARAGALMSLKILQDQKRAAEFRATEEDALRMMDSNTTEYQMTGYTRRRK